MDISIIILNYKNKELALNCIDSIKKSDFKDLSFELIIVDNDSKDGIGEIIKNKYPDIRFIQSEKNVGMGGGNNLGISIAQGKYIVIMNPDTIAKNNTFITLYNYMEENPGVGMAGPKQYYPDGTLQDSSYRWHGLLTPLFRRTPIGKLPFAKRAIDRFLMKDFDRSYAREVDWLLGSFLFCRASALEKVGLFDENFFLYFEDTDLAKRFWAEGFKVVYFPDAEIIHNHQRESAQEPWYRFFINKASRQHIISWLKYLRKWGII